MGNILLVLVALFFIIGVFDYAIGNKLALGKVLRDGIYNMGPLAISMIGILSLTPILVKILNVSLVPLVKKIGIEPSILTSSFIAVDMGGYNMALDLSSTREIAIFSGIVVSSILGCTISFTMPLAMGMIKNESKEALAKGMVCGVITIPLGLYIAGILLKLNTKILIINLMPIIIISLILSFGITYKPHICLKLFKALGSMITVISLIGLALQGVNSIAGINIVEDMMSLDECLSIVGKIGLFLGGSCVMLEVMKKILKKPLSYIEKKFKISKGTMAMLIASLASSIIVFADFEDLDEEGKVICSAFSVSGAYVFGGQLGYVVSVEPSIMTIYIIAKIVSGVAAIILAYIIIKSRGEKVYEG